MKIERVGSLVGLKEGAGVGGRVCRVGREEGCLEGWVEGRLVGCVDGCLEGCLVGWPVGLRAMVG